MGVRRIWAASRGSYSDYEVGLLFTSKELAERAIAAVGGGYSIEEFQLWDELPPTFVTYNKMGRITPEGAKDERAWSTTRWGSPAPEHRMDVHVAAIQAADTHYPLPWRWLTVTSTDRDRLEKVWSERAAQLQAELVGL